MDERRELKSMRGGYGNKGHRGSKYGNNRGGSSSRRRGQNSNVATLSRPDIDDYYEYDDESAREEIVQQESALWSMDVVKSDPYSDLEKDLYQRNRLQSDILSKPYFTMTPGKKLTGIVGCLKFDSEKTHTEEFRRILNARSFKSVASKKSPKLDEAPEHALKSFREQLLSLRLKERGGKKADTSNTNLVSSSSLADSESSSTDKTTSKKKTGSRDLPTAATTDDLDKDNHRSEECQQLEDWLDDVLEQFQSRVIIEFSSTPTSESKLSFLLNLEQIASAVFVADFGISKKSLAVGDG